MKIMLTVSQDEVGTNILTCDTPNNELKLREMPFITGLYGSNISMERDGKKVFPKEGSPARGTVKFDNQLGMAAYLPTPAFFDPNLNLQPVFPTDSIKPYLYLPGDKFTIHVINAEDLEDCPVSLQESCRREQGWRNNIPADQKPTVDDFWSFFRINYPFDIIADINSPMHEL